MYCMACGMLSNALMSDFLRKREKIRFQIISHGPEVPPMDKIYPLGVLWSGECFQFNLAFVNYPLLKKKKKKYNPTFFEWSSREVSP